MTCFQQRRNCLLAIKHNRYQPLNKKLHDSGSLAQNLHAKLVSSKGEAIIALKMCKNVAILQS